ncbi:MAG: helix-turn-helix domain-containing protein [Patescibacteria group bacterium]
MSANQKTPAKSAKPLNQKLRNDLSKLGFTESEIKFYVAGLELGLGTIPQIAARAGLSRMSGYTIFKTLRQKGMADIDVRKYGQKVKVAKPAKLLSMYEERRRGLDTLGKNLPALVGELNIIFASVPEDLEIHYFRAKEAITKIWNEAMTNTKKGDEILWISAVDYFAILNPNFYEFFEEMQNVFEEKGINIKVVFEKTAQTALDKKDKEKFFKESKNMGLGQTMDTVIFEDTVAFIFPGTELFGLAIKSEELANNQSRSFYKLWNM